MTKTMVRTLLHARISNFLEIEKMKKKLEEAMLLVPAVQEKFDTTLLLT